MTVFPGLGSVDQATRTALLSLQKQVASTAWAAPTLLNSWVDYGGVYQIAGYRKVGDEVRVRGLIKSGTTTVGTKLFTLPAGFRPSKDEHLVVGSNGAFAMLYFATSGDVTTVTAVSASWISLNTSFSTS